MSAPSLNALLEALYNGGFEAPHRDREHGLPVSNSIYSRCRTWELSYLSLLFVFVCPFSTTTFESTKAIGFKFKMEEAMLNIIIETWVEYGLCVLILVTRMIVRIRIRGIKGLDGDDYLTPAAFVSENLAYCLLPLPVLTRVFSRSY